MIGSTSWRSPKFLVDKHLPVHMRHEILASASRKFLKINIETNAAQCAYTSERLEKSKHRNSFYKMHIDTANGKKPEEKKLTVPDGTFKVIWLQWCLLEATTSKYVLFCRKSNRAEKIRVLQNLDHQRHFS